MDLAGADEARKAEVREKLADAYYRSSDYRARHAGVPVPAEEHPGPQQATTRRTPTSRGS